jgi:4-amino-4-deoxy-L-arabinose transferase-like glycosyltransferase
MPRAGSYTGYSSALPQNYFISEQQRVCVRDQAKRLLSSTGLIVVVAFAVRVAYLSFDMRHFQQPSVRDDLQFGAELGSVAASIASGHGFASPFRLVPSGPTALFAPIYPYLLAAIFKMFGTFSYTSSVVIRTIQCGFSAFTCWPIFVIGKKAFSKNIGITAAWAWVFFPGANYFPVEWVWDTSIVALWLALVIAATLELRGSDRTDLWIGYGALWGVGAMINPSILAVLPFLALWAIWPLRERFAQAAKLALASGVIFLACITPWAVRNYVVLHAFIPFRSNFALEWWLDNHTQYPDRSVHPIDYQPELDRYVQLTEVPYMAEKKRQALAFVTAYPADAAQFALHRFVRTWLEISESPLDLWRTIPFFVKAMIVANCTFFFLALLGALLALRSQSPAASPLATVLMVYPLVFYITHTGWRYRFPIDSVMLVFAIYALAEAAARIRWRRTSPAQGRTAESLAAVPGRSFS